MIRQNGRVVTLPAATRNYVSSILTSDFKKVEEKAEKRNRAGKVRVEQGR